MKKSNLSRLAKLMFATLVLLCGIAFTGCKPEDAPRPASDPMNSGSERPSNELPAGVAKLSEDDALIGTWVAGPYEYYKITKDTFESEGSYQCNSLVVKADNKTTGRIFVKYDKIYDWNNGVYEDPNDPNYLHFVYESEYGIIEAWYPLNTELVGKWYAICYKDLTSTTISLSGANGTVDDHMILCTDTLEDAINEYTVENGYFEIFSECTKQ